MNLTKIVNQQKQSNCDVVLHYYDDKLLFYPVLKILEKELTIREKGLECSAKTGWMQKVVYKTAKLYAELPTDGKTSVGITYQGFFHRLLKRILTAGLTFSIKDYRIANVDAKTFPAPRLDLMKGFRFSQEKLLSEALLQNSSGLIGAPTRYGKCLSINELCLMHDYSCKKVQYIKVGDKLMGPDGLPRTVVALGRGQEESYRIVPNKGEAFICNKSHILSLKVTGGAKMGGWSKGDIINISVEDYLAKSKTFKHITKLWYASLEFPTKELPYDPWIVGVWLGDGCKNSATITKPDKDIQQAIITWAESNGYIAKLTKSNTPGDTVAISTKEGKSGRYINPLRNIAYMCSDDETRYIPKLYLTGDRQQRLELLAGLIDTDGYSNNGLGYEITTKYSDLADNIVQLCRGLGFRCTKKQTIKGIKATGFKGTYWRLNIAGNLSEIPCRGHKKVYSTKNRVDPTLTGFSVEPVGVKPYYGFELEGPDNLFLLWDHLVTHNTSLIINTLRAFPDLSIVITAPGVDLVKQLYADLLGPRGLDPGREVKLICSSKGKKPAGPGGITVCSADSLNKIDPGTIDLVLADEPHALVTESRLRLIDAFPKARRIGFGATLKGRFDGRDQLIEGVFGHVLVERTYKEAVEEGAICPLHILFLKVEVEPRYFRDRNSAYNSILFHNQSAADLANEICTTVIPADFQTMIFVKDEKQAEQLQETMGRDTTIAMAKRMTNKEREECDRLMKENIIKRCLCTKIYVQGVTFSDVRVLINLEGGGNNTSAIQKPGRLAEIRPGKKYGIVVDLLFVPPNDNWSDYYDEEWIALCRDSKARKTAYEEKGYEITVVDNVQQLKEKFNELI